MAELVDALVLGTSVERRGGSSPFSRTSLQEVVYVTAGSKKLGKNFKKMIALYEYFGKECGGLDWSDNALYDLYIFESTGKGRIKPNNGYAYGKHTIDITISMWKEDLDKTLWLHELYEDPNLPDWWLDKVLMPS